MASIPSPISVNVIRQPWKKPTHWSSGPMASGTISESAEQLISNCSPSMNPGVPGTLCSTGNEHSRSHSCNDAPGPGRGAGTASLPHPHKQQDVGRHLGTENDRIMGCILAAKTTASRRSAEKSLRIHWRSPAWCARVSVSPAVLFRKPSRLYPFRGLPRGLAGSRVFFGRCSVGT
jgi:hypothetical protein